MGGAGPTAPEMKTQPKKLWILAAALLTLTAIIFAIDMAIPLGLSVWIPYLALIVFATRTRSPGFLVGLASLCAALVLLGFILDDHPPYIARPLSLLNRSMGIVVIGILAWLCWKQMRTEAGLAGLVRERTAALEQANAGLQTEAAARTRLIAQLQEALARVTALQGILPLCRICQKIRDDRGSWSEINTYLKAHSDANVIHSVCPECAKNPRLP